MTSKVMQGHIRNHFSTFVYEPIILKICMNAYIMKTHFFVDMFCYFFYFKTFCPNNNLYLRSYGQLLSLFYLINIIAYLSMFWFIKWIIFTINTIILLAFKRLCPVKKVYLLLDYNLFLLIIFHLKPNLIRYLSVYSCTCEIC